MPLRAGDRGLTSAQFLPLTDDREMTEFNGDADNEEKNAAQQPFDPPKDIAVDPTRLSPSQAPQPQEQNRQKQEKKEVQTCEPDAGGLEISVQ